MFCRTQADICREINRPVGLLKKQFPTQGGEMVEIIYKKGAALSNRPVGCWIVV